MLSKQKTLSLEKAEGFTLVKPVGGTSNNFWRDLLIINLIGSDS